MTSPISARNCVLTACILPGTLLLAFLIAGCGQKQGASTTPPPLVKHGMVLGGDHAVSGSTIQMYAVGTTGDGSAATALLSQAVTSDANGEFDITGDYSCPSPTSLVYVVAVGGNPGLAAGTNNAALTMMAALGACGNLTASTSIYINELTTVAATWALAPFMNTYSSIGSGSSDEAALSGAFTLASYFANTSTGTVPGLNVPSGETVPVAQINTLADILASCVNSAGGVVGDGSACGTLFAAATPAGATAPMNVIGAGKNIATNPTVNISSLFALVAAGSPYQPILERAPANLTLGLSRTSGLSASVTALTFPSVTVGVASTPLSVTVTNTGAATITLSGASLSGAAASDFSVAAGCPATLAAGASCAVQVVFTPSAAGTRSASLSIPSSAANSPLTVSLTGTGVAPPSSSLSVSPSALTFPSGTVGVASAPLTVTVKNTGAGAITLSGTSFSGAAASDFKVTTGCPATLAVGASCAVQVVFTPSAAGTRSAALLIPSSAANSPLTVSLTGAGVAGGGTPPPSSSLSVSPAALTFPSATVGVASTPLSVTVTNTGASAITLSGVSFSGVAASDFGVAAGCPATLAVGASCVVQVVFTPSAAGTRSASLLIPSSGANSPLTVPLTGTGVAGGGSGPPPPTLYGHVEGGVQPVSGSAIQMYAVGTTADGSAATALLTQPVSTDENGDFNIAGDYTCPSATSLVYVVAVGGNPGLAAGTNNTALTMMAALGACGNLTATTPIYVNELTTVAAVWALAPYMSSYSSTGSSAGDAAALANAFMLASYYANPSTGTVPGLNVPEGTTVPVAEINTLADILATCVDSPGGAVGDGSACGTLFAATTPVGGTAPGNVISAGLNIADNPTANVAALFGLVPTSPVFQPTLTEAPADFTVGLAMQGLSASPGAILFPAAYVSFTGAPQTVTISNNGTRPFAFSSSNYLGIANFSIIGVNASDFSATNTCSSSLAATATCTVQITFVPSATGVRSAALVIASDAANSPLIVPLSGAGLVGAGGPITLSPSSLNFTQVGVPQNVTVANTGSSPVAIGGVIYGGDTSRTTSQTNDCGTSLAAQSICTLSVQVSSLNQTVQNGTLSVITSAASEAPTMAIQVEALSPPLESFSQTPISLGDWAVGVTSPPLTSYNALTVSTSDPISFVGSFVGPNASDFSLVPLGFYGSGISNGAYNCYRTSCEITIAFTPGGLGLRTATLQTSFGNIPVSGNGIPAGPSFTISPYPQTYESVGTSSFPANLTIVNNGSTSLLLSKTTVTGPNAGDFTVSNQCGASLGSTGTCTNLTVVFTPTQLGPRTATLTITDATSGTAKSIPLNGTGETMAPVVTPSSPSFTNVDIGSVVTQTITVTAPNGDPVNFQAAGSKDYTLSTGACATTPCQVIITFKPSMLGSDNGFFLVFDPYSQLTTDLSIAANVGVAGASLSTSSLTFAARDLGTTSIPQVVTLTNTGDIALTISGIAVNGTNLGDFPIESNTCGANLAPAASCEVSISFAPSATGARSASLSIQNGSANSSLTVSLSGTGTVAGGSPPPVEYGHVEGGVQPVSGSAIQMYAVGTTGGGSAATALLTQPVSTDENGDFNIAGDYTCPSATSLVYVVAVGGNPGLAAGTNNTALTMMAALGACGNLTATTPIRINELTTVAAVWSLAPYMNSYSSIGSDAGDATGIADAFTLASYFVNPSTGTVPGLAVPTGWTVPVAQINTLADILASCVDTAGGVVGDGSACGTLFAAATPIGGTAPVDVIGAGMDIVNNAMANVSTLFGLVTGTAPYQPTLTPSDLTLSLSPVLSLSVSPSSLTFPSAPIGVPPAPLSITITNTSTPNILIPITVGTVSFSGAAASDFTPDYDCSSPLAYGESCTIQVIFTPSAAGVRSATLSIPSNATNSPSTASLTGTGVALAGGPITLSSSSLTFNGVGEQDVTVTNTGTVPVAIGPVTSRITGGGGEVFVIEPILAATNNCGTMLAAQSICTITVEVDSFTYPGFTGIVTLFTGAAPGSQTISVNELPSTASFDGAPIMFGDVPVGSSSISAAELLAVAANDDEESPPLGITITGPNASDFSASSTLGNGGYGQCGGTFACSATITFTPSAPGLRTATAVTNYGNVALSGIGTTGTTGAGTGPSFTVASTYVDPNPNTPVGGSSNGQLSVTNSGTTNLLLSGVVTGLDANSFTATPSQCSPLAPTQTCIFTITFKPLQPGVKTAFLIITDSSSGIQSTVDLSGGTNPTVTLTPTQLTFDNLQIGSISAPQTVNVTTSDGGPITAVIPSWESTDFLLSTGACFLQTPCQLTLRFRPSRTGSQSATLVVSPAMSTASGGVSLLGIDGVPVLSLSTSSLMFDPHATGSTSVSQTVTLTNTGNVALTISGMNFSGTNPGDFPIESNTCGSTLAAGASCTMAISFAPTATGARTASLQIVSNEGSSPTVLQLSGTGN